MVTGSFRSGPCFINVSGFGSTGVILLREANIFNRFAVKVLLLS
jgi:hypothetical protein